MKKLIALIAIALFSETMIAQAATDSNAVPPQAVATAFAARFPDVQVQKWSEKQQTYYATFRWKGKKTSAYYAPDGSWKATEVLMHWSRNLPETVKQAWRHSDFAAWYLMDISKIETPDGLLYALHVNNSPLLDSDHAQIDHDEYEIFFNEKGELVRKDNKD
jgi:Putative beta-lactamase-inhibitor-like, PepSY-like